MLQQTRVETVIPYYERFLERWPTVDALAKADPDEVRAAWSGLGYYRRARLMMEAARGIVRDHEGALPRNLEQLRALPGFGRYTAGAVASIAFDLEAPAVDGNVSRVLSRILAVEGDAHGREQSASIWHCAEDLTRGESPGDVAQSLIEIGAIVCTPRSPRCGACPVEEHCRARSLGRESEIPPPRKRAARSMVETTALLDVGSDGRLMLERQPANGLFADLWCLPMVDGHLEPDAVIDEALRKYGLEIDRAEIAAEVKHVLTHRDIMMRIARVSVSRRSPARKGFEVIRVRLDELAGLGVPSMTVRALKASLPDALLDGASWPGRRSASVRRRS
jgi:A/G-specific adenine glycosylase